MVKLATRVKMSLDTVAKAVTRMQARLQKAGRMRTRRQDILRALREQHDTSATLREQQGGCMNCCFPNTTPLLLTDLNLEKLWVVYPGEEHCQLHAWVEAISHRSGWHGG